MEGGEVEGEVVVLVHVEVGGLQVPLHGDLGVCEVAGPLEKEGWGVALEGVSFCDSKGKSFPLTGPVSATKSSKTKKCYHKAE
jgi:hypothetical protein